MAVSVEDPPTHIGVGLALAVTNRVFTTTVTFAVLVHPLFVTTTVYVVVVAGLAVAEAFVPSPLLHWYVPPPVAVSVDDSPGQIEVGMADAVALTVFTVTVVQAVAVHPFKAVTVTQ